MHDTSEIGDDCLQERGCFDNTAGRPGLKHLTLDVKFRLINLILRGRGGNVWKTVDDGSEYKCRSHSFCHLFLL